MDWDNVYLSSNVSLYPLFCYGDVIIDPLYMQLVAMVIAQETDAY